VNRVERALRKQAAERGVDYDAHDSVRSLCAAIAARETVRESGVIAIRVMVRGRARRRTS
jgi:hypothetical protein